jgi:putative ABC transport system permease protein
MLLLRMALRNGLRNVKRSALTASTVTLGTALLTVALSWMAGVFGSLFDSASKDAGHVRIATPAYQQREALLPLYENLEGVGELSASLSELDGVVGAFPRIASPVTLTVGEELGDSFAMAMALPRPWYDVVLGIDGALVDGTSFTDDLGQVVLGAAVAENLGASVGDEVVLLGQTQDGAMSPLKGEVVGIVQGAGRTVEQAVFLTLDQGQWLADLPDGATEVLVYGDHRDDAEALAARIAGLESVDGLAVRPWQQTPLIAAILVIAGVLDTIMSGLIVFICALAVWNTMMMSVLERTSETGVLRAMGMTRRGVVALFVAEGLGIAVVGGLGGVLVGGAGALYLETVGVDMGGAMRNVVLPMQSRLYADMSLDVATTAMLVAVLTALVGTALPAYTASRAEPSDAMRVGR